MNLFTGESADEFFGGDVPATVRQILHRAAQAPRTEVGSLLWTAQLVAPDGLPVYYALYKHHASQREWTWAERAARRGLVEAARQAGLPADEWQVQPGHPAATFRDNGPARFWLFTLKALAFLALRQQRLSEARELLAHIQRLDPEARIGDDVIASLLRSMGPDL
ncbi:hypothetical protein AACH06_21490 [Ideonella sp. DXS29W]|uniref:Tetratricopeptide repeat protein n=1 Tax=Ideonella lacteola TaxID=2984193 RepID=A0ABU9BTW4_9BURK